MRTAATTTLDGFRSIRRDWRSRFSGQLLTADDAEYQEARRIWNGMIDRRPAIIVRCLSEADVIEAVLLARKHQLEVSIRGGGHSVAGHSVYDGGLMIDLSLMKTVHVNATEREATAEPGLTWAEFDRSTTKVVLRQPAGKFPTRESQV